MTHSAIEDECSMLATVVFLDTGWVLETEVGLTASFLSIHLNVLFSSNFLAAQGYHFIIGEVMRL